MLTPYQMSCEYSKDPIGIDVVEPRLSWKSKSSERGARQTAYRIIVSSDPDHIFAATSDASEDKLLWDSGRVESDASVHVAYGAGELEPGRRYYWSVRLWDEEGKPSDWSETAFWEMGLLDSANWTAEWITPDGEENADTPQPAPFLRRSFTLQGEIASARLYVTSLGLYHARINGRPVGDSVLDPGWTSYDYRIQYQTYDVTELMQEGENAIGVILGDGWYRGYIGFDGSRGLYGKKLALLAQLSITYSDGGTETIVTDGAWRATTGPIQMADIYMGETYDARLEFPGWDSPDYNDAEWKGVHLLDHSKEIVVAQSGPQVERQERITPIEVLHSPKGETIYDFGQNMVGWVRLKVTTARDTILTLRHAEVLDQEGNLYTDNLRTAEQTVTYICRGTEGDEEVYEPHFTFQGFRYVAVEGLPADAGPDALTGVVLHSAMEIVGSFECSNTLINQLQHNILWGQKGNYVDVPTDCPQRDERLGWTGDAQVFIDTACFNMNVAGFFTKWLRDLRADQRPDGNVPFVSPDVLGRSSTPGFGSGGAGSSAWGDAAVICPWTIYTCYGDIRILEEQYSGMSAWVDYIQKNADENDLWTGGFHFGDWLDYRGPAALMPSPVTNKELVSTAFYAYSADLVSRAAEVLGKGEDFKKYSELSDRVKKAFCDEFVTAGGRIGPNTQTAYVLALHFDLLPEELRPAAAERLAREVREVGYHLTTGFVGTPYLCHTLSRYGFSDVAYELLNRESFPSWLYPVKKGATTIWERWDGIKPDGSFQDVGMNSFNHYAYGAIGAWLYQVVAGIQVDPAEPGYKHILFRPQPGGGLTEVRADLESPYGLVKSAWSVTDTDFRLSVSVPVNAHGTVSIPAGSADSVTEGGAPISKGRGIESIRMDAGIAEIEIGAGTYEFVTPALTKDMMMAKVKHIAGRLDRYSTLGDLLADDAARSILTDHIDEAILSHPFIGHVMGMPFERLANSTHPFLSPEQIEAIDGALQKL